MNSSPSSRFRTFGKIALIGLGALVLLLASLLLFVWLALPHIVQSQAEKYVAEKTGHRLVLDVPELNPIQLTLRLGKLRLSAPDGAPLLAFTGLRVDLSTASFSRRALVFDAIRLDGLEATLVELPAGLNWTPFIAALKSKDAPDAQTGWPLHIRSFTLADGRLDYTDRRRGDGFATRIEPLDLTLTDIATQPGTAGSFKLAARSSIGARVELAGKLQLDPLAVGGSFSLADLQLGQLAPYFRNALPVPPEGVVTLAARYQVGAGRDGTGLAATFEQVEAKLAGLRVTLRDAAGPVASADDIELKDGRYQLEQNQVDIGSLAINGGRLALPGIDPPPHFTALTGTDIRVALAARQASVGRLALADGRVQAVREAAGTIDLLEALKHLAGAKPVAAAAGQPVAAPIEPAAAADVGDAAGQEAAAPWRFRIDRLALAGLGAVLRDATVTPAAELAFDDLTLDVEGVGDDMTAPLPLRLAFDIRSGGRFEGAGTVVPATQFAELKLRLADFSLKPIQPYLADRTSLVIANGKLSIDGNARRDAGQAVFQGGFSLRNLSLAEGEAGNTLLAWKDLGTTELTVTPQRLAIGELRLNGLDTRLLIDKDKNVNLKRVVKAVPDAAPSGDKDAAPAYRVDVERVRIDNSELFFSDHSLVLPFGTRIHGLRGSLGNLSSRPGGVPGQLQLEGTVDEYGLARATGEVDLLDPTGFMDIRVVFRNVEMTRLTPYTATFAGRKIDSGKLALDLQYKIAQRQLQGENRIVMDKLVLGERVASATAQDLPLDLAVALLQDSAGRIDLGLPVAGSLDDPQFSYGQIIGKAFGNLVTGIVTAPFRALAALFGGKGKMDDIAFEAGAGRPTPPEREKLVKLAAALAQRPGLVLAVRGTHAEIDRAALQDAQARHAVVQQMGLRVEDGIDPGPLSTRQPRVQAALEVLFAGHFGAAELAALREGFRRASPRQPAAGGANPVDPSGPDLHAHLFERLRARESVGDDQLQALARARAANAIGVLKSAGLAAERLATRPPQAVEPVGGEVPLLVSLEAAGAAGKTD